MNAESSSIRLEYFLAGGEQRLVTAAPIAAGDTIAIPGEDGSPVEHIVERIEFREASSTATSGFYTAFLHLAKPAERVGGA